MNAEQLRESIRMAVRDAIQNKVQSDRLKTIGRGVLGVGAGMAAGALTVIPVINIVAAVTGYTVLMSITSYTAYKNFSLWFKPFAKIEYNMKQLTKLVEERDKILIDALKIQSSMTDDQLKVINKKAEKITKKIVSVGATLDGLVKKKDFVEFISSGNFDSKEVAEFNTLVSAAKDGSITFKGSELNGIAGSSIARTA